MVNVLDEGLEVAGDEDRGGFNDRFWQVELFLFGLVVLGDEFLLFLFLAVELLGIGLETEGVLEALEWVNGGRLLCFRFKGERVRFNVFDNFLSRFGRGAVETFES